VDLWRFTAKKGEIVQLQNDSDTRLTELDNSSKAMFTTNLASLLIYMETR